EQYGAGSLENKIRKPDDQMRGELRSCVQGLSENDETVINCYQYQRQSDPNICLAPMDPDPQRNAYQRKPETSKRKCNLLMDLDADRRRQVMALFFPFAFRRLNLFGRKISHRQRFTSAH